MADAKLSELTELAAIPAINDELYIRDVSEAAVAESKRITVANLMGGALTIAETEVFNGTSPNPSAWTDLDLSAVVGVNTAFVLLRFYNADAAARYTGFRINGETEVSIFDQGPFSTEQIGATSFGYGLCLTDTNGVIEWYYSDVGQAGVTIDVIAYIKGH